jgi:hypothetical protein
MPGPGVTRDRVWDRKTSNHLKVTCGLQVRVVGAEALDREEETATVARVILSDGEPVSSLVAKRVAD